MGTHPYSGLFTPRLRRTSNPGVVVKYLREISEDHPGDAIACLASLDIVGGGDRWKAELWRDEAKEIIRRGPAFVGP